MSVPGIAEQITLDSGESEIASITPNKDDLKKVTLEIVQFNKLHKTQKHIRVFDHKTLYVKEKVGKETRFILLDLSLVDENPVRIRDFNTATLVASIAVSLFAVIAFYIQMKGLLNVPALYMHGAVALLAVISVFCFVLTAKSFKDTLAFKTAHGQVPFLFLFNNIPAKANFKQFVKALKSNIELARGNSKHIKSKIMPAIVSEHRSLYEKGFITEAQFEQAKKNILSS